MRAARGWEITQGTGDILCATTFRLLTRQPDGTPQLKAELQSFAAEYEEHVHFQALVRQLLRLLDGVRDASLWQAPELDYDDAAEILLLLERLERGEVAEEEGEAPADDAALDPTQLLPALRRVAADNDIDLATMEPTEKAQFVATVLLQLTNKTPDDLSEGEQQSLAHQAMRLAEEL